MFVGDKKPPTPTDFQVTAEEDDLNERIDEGMTTFAQTKKDDLAYSQSTKFYDKSLLPSTVI